MCFKRELPTFTAICFAPLLSINNVSLDGLLVMKSVQYCKNLASQTSPHAAYHSASVELRLTTFCDLEILLNSPLMQNVAESLVGLALYMVIREVMRSLL